MLELTDHTLTLLLQKTAELAAKHALSRTGKLKPYLTKAQAFREFGRANIEHWLVEGLITPRKDGDHSASWRIDRVEVESIHMAIELSRYL